MKNLTKLFFLTLIVGTVAVSCKEEENPIVNTNPLENGMEAILSRAAYSAFDEDGDGYELGFSFSSSKAGKISKLGLKLPQNGTYEVSLWDFDTKAKLDSVNVTNSDSSRFNYASISPRSIVAGKKYVVSVFTAGNDYFCASAPGLFPFTSGSITVFDQREDSVDETGFPDATIRTNNYCGIAGFVFQAD
jgi:hypothetical protein